MEHERTLLAPLDHPSGIAMVVDSRLERDMRAGACAKEPETVEWLERVLGGGSEQCLYDIGACSGSYSLLAAKLRSKVVAFEPSALNFRQLVRNIWINRLDVLALPVALGDRTEISTIGLSSDLAGAAGHSLVGDAPITAGHSVMVWRLDDLARTFQLFAPTAMKLDVDGYEEQVLRGAFQVLRHPSLRSVMIEVRTQTRGVIAELLVAAGFVEVGDHRRIAADTFNVVWSR
jgi:FkbM family methyltransferase